MSRVLLQSVDTQLILFHQAKGLPYNQVIFVDRLFWQNFRVPLDCRNFKMQITVSVGSKYKFTQSLI